MKKLAKLDATANFVVTDLPAYVAENRDLLIADIVLGSSTLERISIQTGVKYKAPIHILDFDEELQAMGCNPSVQDDNLALTDRVITTATMGHLIPICEDNLLGKWGEYAVRITASDEDLAFEEYVVDAIVANVHNKLEKLIWQGITSDGDLIDGFAAIAADDAPAAQKLTLTGSAYEGILQAYLALPEEVLNFPNVEIYVGPAIFRAFVAEVTAANLYHFNPNDATAEEIYLPGAAAKVVKRAGLSGTNCVLATYAKNLYYGCDLENAKEDIRIFHEEKEDQFYAKVKFNAGVQIAFPNRVVLGEFVATPTATAPAASSLAKIAGTVDEGQNAINTIPAGGGE